MLLEISSKKRAKLNFIFFCFFFSSNFLANFCNKQMENSQLNYLTFKGSLHARPNLAQGWIMEGSSPEELVKASSQKE
jgi:hypothetical protein